MSDLIILSPFYLPAPGGAGRYYSLLVNELSGANEFEKIEVITERYPNELRGESIGSGNVKVQRIFPFRAGCNGRSRFKYFKYLFQNIQIVLLFFKLIRGDVTLLIHGYFFNNLSSVNILVLLLRLNPCLKLKVVADLRDPKLNPRHISRLNIVDEIIMCSKNIGEHLKLHGWKKKNLHYIPIPYEQIKPGEANISSLLRKLKLENKRFIFTPNGISQEKSINEIIDLTEALISKDKVDVLVVAGRSRDWDHRIQEAEDNGVLMYIGSIKHEDVLCLISAATLVPVISSSIEGMPRSALEAISLNTAALLPSNVPEFEAFSEVCIKNSDELGDVVNKALVALDGHYDTSDYDLELHEWKTLNPLYLSLLTN